jgi:hypothetical protein
MMLQHRHELSRQFIRGRLYEYETMQRVPAVAKLLNRRQGNQART